MKKYMISLMMLASFSAFATNNHTGKKTEKAPVAVVAAESAQALTMRQLQDENNLLRLQLTTVQNENEELKSRLQYEGLMHNLLSQLNNERLNDEAEDMKASLKYNQMMANLLNKIQASKK